VDWEQKFNALNAIAACVLIMRKPGDWYVSHPGTSVKDGGCLVGSYGNGSTPQLAILDHWKVLVDDITPTEKYLVLNPASDDRRRAVRWNGFMWQDVVEASPC
jgi:hypothetical protein